MVGMIVGVGVLWLVALAPSAWLALGYAVLFGIGYSVTAFIVPAMMSDRFRGPHFGSIFGATQVASALGSALGAWLAGRIFDATGSYAIAFSLAAGAAGGGRAVGVGGPVPRRGRRGLGALAARGRATTTASGGWSARRSRADRGPGCGGRRGRRRTGRARARGPRCERHARPGAGMCRLAGAALSAARARRGAGRRGGRARGGGRAGRRIGSGPEASRGAERYGSDTRATMPTAASSSEARTQPAASQPRERTPGSSSSSSAGEPADVVLQRGHFRAQLAWPRPRGSRASPTSADSAAWAAAPR